MIPEETILKIIKYAAKAPSGHNTQPWKFKMGEDTISILPDFTRALPVVDSDNHALYISLGCALENMIIAANQFNYETKVEIINYEKISFIRINLIWKEDIMKPELFNYILKRQVTRNTYKKTKIQDFLINEIFHDIIDDGVKIKVFTSDAEIENLIPYIIKGNDLQFNNKAFIDELISWFRFSEKEVLLKGDGLWAASMGLPNFGRRLGRFVMRNFVSAKSEAKRWKKLIYNSAGLALFMVENNNPDHWIKLGQTFQRFGLKAAKFNVSHAHVNMPCEEQQVREELVHDYQLNGLTPLLLIRFGYSQSLPYSFRRNMKEIIVKS